MQMTTPGGSRHLTYQLTQRVSAASRGPRLLGSSGMEMTSHSCRTRRDVARPGSLLNEIRRSFPHGIPHGMGMAWHGAAASAFAAARCPLPPARLPAAGADDRAAGQFINANFTCTKTSVFSLLTAIPHSRSLDSMDRGKRAHTSWLPQATGIDMTIDPSHPVRDVFSTPKRLNRTVTFYDGRPPTTATSFNICHNHYKSSKKGRMAP